MPGILTLTVSSPVQTFAEPVSLLEARSYLGLPVIDTDDSERNDLINLFIVSARREAEIELDVDLTRKQWDLLHDDFCCGTQVEMLRRPLVSVDLVRRRDRTGAYTTLVAETDYLTDLDKGVILPPYGVYWPSSLAYPSSALLIRFTSGYLPTDVFWRDEGTTIKLAMLHLISGWFNNRLPYESGAAAIAKYPYTAAMLLRGVPRVG